MEPRRTPKVDVLKLKQNKVKFVLSDTDVSIANALRRAMIAEVPTLAIDLVNIEANNSVLFDEYLAHRLGLVPLRYKEEIPLEDVFTMGICDNCEDFCDQCAVELVLDVKHDGDEEKRVVTSMDLRVVGSYEGRVEVVHFATDEERESLGSTDFGITLVKLARGQHVRLHALAKLGNGKMHAKYNPVCVATFHYEPIIKLNPDLLEQLSPEEKSAFVAAIQPDVMHYDKESNTVSVVNAKKANNTDEILKVGALHSKTEDNLVSVSIIPDKFIFKVETTGSLTPAQVVMSAISALRTKLESVQLVCHELKDESERGLSGEQVIGFGAVAQDSGVAGEGGLGVAPVELKDDEGVPAAGPVPPYAAAPYGGGGGGSGAADYSGYSAMS